MVVPAWNRYRVPCADPGREAERTDSYWRWLQANIEGIRAKEPAPAVCEWDDFRLVPLRDAGDADWEASWMEHSVGYSWSRYSQFGDIYGMRDADGIPVATLLVSDGSVVHARERRNARLGFDAQAAMEGMAYRMGWGIKPDPLPFETWGGLNGGSTVLSYMARSDGRPAAFGKVVLHGNMDMEVGENLATALANSAHFMPETAGIPPLDGFEGEVHEILSLTDTDEEATLDLSLDEFTNRLGSPRPPAAP